MAFQVVDQDPVRGTKSITSWYDCSRPLWIDLIGDYAGKELFLVEGDSLLRECFEDKRIDFDGGFQLLHAVYVVERFLEDLVKRHCNFHIAFFEENADLCIPRGVRADRRSRYLLARSAIRRHLTIHLPSAQPDVQVNTFPTLESDEFREYLHISPIHFVAVHDGASKPGQDSTEETQTRDILAKTLLRGMIWHFNTHKLNVAILNRIEFRDSKVFTMIVESFTSPSKIRFTMAAEFGKEIIEARKLLAETQAENDKEPKECIETVARVNLEELANPTVEEGTSESSYLATYAVSKILGQGDCNVFVASAFLLHTIISKHVPLSKRTLPLIRFDADFEKIIDDFLARFSVISRQIMDSSEWNDIMEAGEIESDTVDLVDGRLFRAVIRHARDTSSEGVLYQELQEDWIMISKLVKRFSNEDLSLVGSNEYTSVEVSGAKSGVEVSEDLAVLPFSNPIFDKHLECIHVTTDTSLATRMDAMKLYRGTSYWHNHRKPLNPKLPPAQKISKWRNPLRMNQFYMNEMTSYAASLTGAKGKALDAETITVGPKKLVKLVEEKTLKPEKIASRSKKEEDSKNLGPNSKKGTKKAAGGLSKKEQMIADNKERKGGTEADKIFTAWVTVMKGLDAMSDNQDRYLKTMAYLKNLDSTKTAYLEAEVNTYILQSLLNWWTSYCKDNTKSEGYHVVALIWTTVRSICTSSSPITKEIIQHVTKVCTLLGITDALSSLSPFGTDRKLSFAFKYTSQPQILRIDITQSELQLDYCGPYMDRMLDAKPDPRVNFVPDGWQRDVLDQLDANKSVFVVAPTSSGKTFISFYAMEQVLRADNDGVLVYVAPTKALVNQIAAEVQGRFSKKYPQPGKGVWAIHTRDYRVNNSTGCQILVTVPHVLQIMLMSPSNAKSWAPRVRRIIFDEIHSIGQAEDGVVWEQLLLLAPCPIVALSATVGNPGQFNEWLIETQKSSGSELKMIQHSTRYSDLRKYIYEPPKVFHFTGFGKSEGVGLGLDGLTGFESFHPIASLVNKSRGMPDDLALEPRDCFSLWKAMTKFQTENYPMLDSLSPKNALPPCIRKADIFSWEKSLKRVLLEWMADANSPFDLVVADLTPPEQADATDQMSLVSPSVTDADTIDPLDLKSTTLPLLYQLHNRRALPAILFNYDREACEDIAFARWGSTLKASELVRNVLVTEFPVLVFANSEIHIAFTLLQQLLDAESKWKEGPQWRKLMAGFEKYQELKEKKSRKPAKSSKKTKDDDDEGGSKMDRMRDESSDGSSIYDSFDPEAPQEEFSFANTKQLQKAQLDEYVRQLRRKYIKEELIDLLKRGIGVHHAGMNRKYRQCVEMLFRKGFLRVVIATGTLSLGINMPCATVVFSGDSVFLTALNFRQASGRSGRRGFDLLGNVVFQGISRERAGRLLSSQLPELTGHFPITTSLVGFSSEIYADAEINIVLRLFTLLTDSKNSPYAVKAINSLLSQPRLYLGGQSFREQVLHHLRFSIEYLRRFELLGPGGEPVNFTSCVSHLYYTENSSFAFHALLEGGYFHEICADIDTKPDLVLQNLVLVLSHLFGRRVCREVDDEVEAERIKQSPSIVFLPPMPEEAADILRRHNQKTLDIFTTYAKTFAAQHARDEERYLPLTHTPVGAAVSGTSSGKLLNGHTTSNGHIDGGTDSSAVDFLPSLPTPHARSSFVALSGLGDKFSTIEDLCSSTREGVFLESAVIPHLELHPDETRSPLNAYLLDFYMHGSIVPLEDANGIRKSDVWFLLNDFSLVLATIATSLALHLGLGIDADAELLEVMGSGDAAENDGDEIMAAEAIPDTTPAKTTSAPQQTFAKKGKKVVDDWDAGEDAMAAEENYLKKEGENGPAATDDEEYDKLMNVYKAFRKLKTEFDAKFREIWA